MHHEIPPSECSSVYPFKCFLSEDQCEYLANQSSNRSLYLTWLFPEFVLTDGPGPPASSALITHRSSHLIGSRQLAGLLIAPYVDEQYVVKIYLSLPILPG